MKFKINDREWTIKEVTQEDFWKDEGEENKIGRYYTIVIDNYSENDYEVLRDELTLFN